MIATIKKLLKDLLTENDGTSYCPVRVFAVGLSVPALLLFVTGFTLKIINGHFDGQEMALAFSTMMAGFAAAGAGVAVKAMTDTDSTKQ